MSTPGPRLVDVSTGRDPQGVVLVLHGGGARPGSSAAVSPTQLSVLRMEPIAKRIVVTTRGRLAVLRLLNTHRGWNAAHTPVDDVHWALGEVRDRWGEQPVALVGHSLGGRAALLAGDAPTVRTVVALNPWVTSDDVVDLRGRHVLVVQGDRDRIASPARSRQLADTIARTTDLRYVTVPGGKHAMLRHGRTFERLAAEFVRDTIVPALSHETHDDSRSEPLS